VKKYMAYPYGVWMLIFIIAPILLVVFYAFTDKSGTPTIDNFTSMLSYASIFGRSFLLAFAATVVCLLLGYPLAYIMSKQPPRWQSLYMMLIMLPMWMNFLLRTYAWMSILENNGFINQFLNNIGFIALLNHILQPETPITYLPLINTGGAVVLGMVYNFLPFMVLPIYNVLIKIDKKLIEAAQDLGAPSGTVFRKVIFPLSMPGVVSGITMVFVPAVSTFVISKTLGGGKEMLIGDLIDLQFMGNAYNPQLGSAIALVMMVLVFLCMLIMNRSDDGSGEEGGLLL